MLSLMAGAFFQSLRLDKQTARFEINDWHERIMAAKDIYHDDVRDALIKDAWTITDDPLRLRWGKKDYYVDLGAEQVIAAEKPGRRIAVEIKSFVGPSIVDDVEKALGQFLIYRSILRRRQPERGLFLAIPKDIARLFDEPLGKLLLEDYDLQLVVFDSKKREIIRWLP
jgi:hypothetical protein